MNVWTDPNTAFSQLGRRYSILLLLLDCPPISTNPTRNDLARNWRLLKTFAEISGTPIATIDEIRSVTRLVDVISLHEGDPCRHLVIAGKGRGGSILPIMLEAALLGLQTSIVYDAFLDGRFMRTGVMPVVSRRPWENAPLYVTTSQVLASMMAQQGVDEEAS